MMAKLLASPSTLAFLLLLLSPLATSQQGRQFITGACTTDADCASSCCGFNTGKCAGPVIAQERDGGCGFGDAQPNDRAAVAFRAGQAPAPAPATTTTDADPATDVNGTAMDQNQQQPPTGQGSQFITGPCAGDKDCASGCCGFNTGKCAGPVIAQVRDGGCGFGDAAPNDAAARAFRGERRRRAALLQR